VINSGGVDVHQAGVQFGVDGRVWHALPYATHCLVGEQWSRLGRSGTLRGRCPWLSARPGGWEPAGTDI
jgi:hypothetical protein